jgi:hypothetical protein
MKKNQPNIKTIVLLAKFSDGKIRQVLICQEVKDMLMGILAIKTGSIQVLETPIEGIDFHKNTTLVK